MMKPHLVRLAALTLTAVAMTAPHHRLFAQGAQVQLAFGYECGDRYLVRNDGANDVDVEYGVAGDPQRWPVHLKGKESVEISSTSTNALELRVGGKVVSTAHNLNRPCAAAPAAQGQPEVVVRPIDEGEYATAAQVAPQVVYAQPPVVYVGPTPVYVTRPYYPYYYYPQPRLSVVFPFAFGFGGHSRTVVIGRGFPGRGYAVPRGRRH
jgi:hypothetical protein